MYVRKYFSMEDNIKTWTWTEIVTIWVIFCILRIYLFNKHHPDSIPTNFNISYLSHFCNVHVQLHLLINKYSYILWYSCQFESWCTRFCVLHCNNTSVLYEEQNRIWYENCVFCMLQTWFDTLHTLRRFLILSEKPSVLQFPNVLFFYKKKFTQ